MNDKIEINTLKFGAIINLIMAIAGWCAYYLSNSQALLLDGNFSFLAFISTLIAIKISSIKQNKSEVFPFGHFVYESLYSLLKGVMIVGILLVALTENISKIIHYLDGKETFVLNTSVILVYATTMTILSFITAFYYKKQNKNLNDSSTILKVEYTELIIDGFMSAVIGVILVSINFIDINGNFGFLHYIGDALLVVLLVVFLGKEPFKVIRNSFIELAGGTLQNKIEKKNIEDILSKHLSSNNLLKNSYISKTGSSYLIVAYLNSKEIDIVGLEQTLDIKNSIFDDLKKIQNEIIFEIILD